MKLTILSFLILFFLSNTAVSEDITYTEGDFSYYMTNEGAVLVDWENSGEKLPLSTLIVPNTLGIQIFIVNQLFNKPQKWFIFILA